MSASNFLHQGDAVHLGADGATYLPDGTVLSIGSKIKMLACGAAYVQRGATGDCEYIIGRMLDSPATFDGAVAIVGDVLHDILAMAKIAAIDIPEGQRDIEIKMAGWSAQMQRLVGWRVASRVDAEEVEQGFVPFVPRMMSVVDFAPDPACDVLELWGLPAAPTFDELMAIDPASAMLAVLEQQRASEYDLPHVSARKIVGGFAEMVTITKEGAAKRVLRKWPDHIGRKIKT